MTEQVARTPNAQGIDEAVATPLNTATIFLGDLRAPPVPPCAGNAHLAREIDCRFVRFASAHGDIF